MERGTGGDAVAVLASTLPEASRFPPSLLSFLTVSGEMERGERK